MSQLWVISYDIGDDKTRRNVFELLKNNGEAIQYSVFECYLTPERQRMLRSELLQFIDPVEDSLRWYPVCRWCQKELGVMGIDKITEDEAFYLV